MATISQSHAVKSLNKSPGRKRFVFKNFSQRLEDIGIDVYKSFDPLKSEPSEGSTFLKDCLIEWRELNTAADFISLYEDMIPFVHNLPMVILHKELLLSKLLSRLQLKARLSLEPILRLIAALSRDLLEGFIPSLPRIIESLRSLLESGADREPEIIEQIFTSWSYIIMYLQKYLIHKVVDALEVTISLRYYPKDYIQEFMAEAMSLLLRNAPIEQLIEGVGKIALEVAKEPLVTRRSGVSSLLWYIMRGTPSKFHSRAEQVMRLLIDESIFSIGDKFNPGSDTVVEVISTAFERLCKDLETKELDLMWDCLYHEIAASVNNGSLLHLKRLLSLLNSTLRVNYGRNVSDYKPLIALVNLIVQKLIMPSGTMITENRGFEEVVDVILQLMLCVLDGLQSLNETSLLSDISLQWAPVFEMRNVSLLNFIKELVQKNPSTLYAFREYIVRAFSHLIDNFEEDVIYMMLCLTERMQGTNPRFLLETSDESVLKIQGHLQELIREVTTSVNICDPNLALLWGAIGCYPLVLDMKDNMSLLMEFVDAIDHLLTNETGNTAGYPVKRWQSLIGAALSSYCKFHFDKEALVEETSKLLHLANRYNSSSQVLFSIADMLDSIHGPMYSSDSSLKLFHPALKGDNAEQAVKFFADNTCSSDKGIRISTLRILCHYEPLFRAEAHSFNVIQLFLSIEETSLSISTSRKVVLLISRIQNSLTAGVIHEAYVPLVMNGIIGIFYNRFTPLWDPASECLSVLISNHVKLVWDMFVHYLKQCQDMFLTSNDKDGKFNPQISDKSSDLVERFNLFVTPASDSTTCATVLILLLQSLQKIASIVESRSRHIIPLFLKFLGYNNEDLVSVGSFNLHVCEGKEWKAILKEWLNLLKLMRNTKSFYQSQFLKEVLLIRLLDENDVEIQSKVLDCLLLWKDNFLLPYDQHLKNLISSKNLREELTTWSLSEGANLINDDHRTGLVPYVIRLLIPKVRNLKMFSSRKHASVQHRKAVLSFIAQLEVNELPLFYALLVKPLQTSSMGSEGTANWFWGSLGSTIAEFHVSNILNYFTVDNITALSWKKRNGFLHVIEDVIKVFDHTRVSPYLDLLLGCIVRILESCTSSLESGKCNESSSIIDHHSSTNDKSSLNQIMTITAMNQFKDLRSLCLRIISLILNKFEDHDFSVEFWDLFFLSVNPLICSFKQEGSSSEKPSSLFSCFIAMSKSHNLVPLLNREDNLVPDIFSILAAKKVSEAVLSCVLEFIANLLSLDSELIDEDRCTKKIIIPNLEALVCSLHCLFQSDNVLKRKLVKCPGERVLVIFKLLSKYIMDRVLAGRFIDIMLPFLEQRVPNSDVCGVAVQVIRDIIPVSGADVSQKILRAASPLLISAEQEMRLCICDLLHGLAGTDRSITKVAELLLELNATSVIEMGECDYDTILNAYGKISLEFFRGVRQDHALVILSHCIYDMSSGESILRDSAYRSLLLFLEFCSFVLEEDADNHREVITNSCILGKGADNHPVVISEMEVDVVHFNWTGTIIQRIIREFILKHLSNAMNKETPGQKLWIDLLRSMVLKLPEVLSLNSLKALSSEDAEVDFFNNIMHIQKHRRARALVRFKNVLDVGNFSQAMTSKVFTPLFLNMLFNVQDGKGEHVRSACVEALASISRHMEWNLYYKLLQRCFREMTLKPDKQKILSRLVYSILDKFPFKDSVKDNIAIQTCLQKSVLPKIHKVLSSHSDKINVNINLAALKLLKLLPGEIMESQLPSIIHRISNFLKNRMESVREDARSALAACLKELGFSYLPFVVGVMRSILKRGYEMHVLGYTLNFILTKSLINNSSTGLLNDYLRDLLFVVENDLLGDVSEEKEVEKIASKMKETRKPKSLETLKLIAQNITFKTHALKLLLPITIQLQKQHLTTKVKSKLESMLKQIAAGIECNPSVDQSDLFIFVYSLIEDGVPKEKQLKDFGSKSQSFHLITVFALGVLHNHIKNLKMDKKNEALLSMLDPFVKLLGNCLSSKYEDILSASLRCLAPLVRLPLPSLESQAEKIKTTLLSVTQNSVNTNSPLMQACLRLLTLLLRSTKITLSTDQLHLLIQFPMFIDLQKNPSFVALSLLKAIVNRKLVVPEIYDVVSRAAELIVTSQDETIRKKSSQIFLQFLLDYRISKKRLQQHLDFLINNLRYVHSSGRESVLEMLHAIIMKFPKSIVNEQSETLFIYLVGCLANDHDNKVRSMTGAALKLLVARVSPDLLRSIVEDCLSWYSGENQKIWSVAAQVLGLLVEVMKKGFEQYINSLLPVIRSILQSSITVVNQGQQDISNEPTIPFWKEAYYSLVLLEKILHEFRELCLDKELEDIWEIICEFLAHPHTWLRNISNRLVGLYFSVVTEARETHGKLLQTYSLMSPSKLFTIAVLLCCQLKSQVVDDDANNVITQNLVFAIAGVHSLMGRKECVDPHMFWSTIDQHDQSHFLKALNLLDPRKGKSMFVSLISSANNNQSDPENSEEPRDFLVSNLLKRMGKDVLQMEDIQMKIVFNCFNAISSQIGSEDCQHYASQLVLPLYKVCEGFAGKVISDDVKQLAQQVCKNIDKTLGNQNYVLVCNQIRKNLKTKRDTRKQEEKVMAVVNPMRNAKRKRRLTEKSQANKKRKMMNIKIKRWAR